MRNLRNRFERFCYRNRSKGIPNLMLYITLGSALVYLMSMFKGTYALYDILYFDRALILQGQVWRLFTYVFTYDAGNILLTAVGLLCYFSLGRAMENIWGTLRFNLFYLTGIILMDIYAMLFPYGWADVSYLNMSLFLGYATLYPDAHFLLFFIIPVRAWIFAVIDLALTIYNVIMLSSVGLFPFSLFPLVAIANYFLFFGKDVLNVIPMSWRVNARRLFKKKPKAKKATGTIPFSGSYQASAATVKVPYTHRCTICGRTDVSHPNLEFRYCSRCNGYHCYCEDHISNHKHIE
ncbi:MAG: rhomboid family intramembrane serine protease [Oscillospiraceae bacterium]|nr:rhomboid family intramembrane serine protease [Oscillospiraceae bacterium]